MNELQVTGKQEFMGKEIPVILGGFGEDKKCISDKTIAEIHGMELKHVRELVNRNVRRFSDSVDVIDLKSVVQDDQGTDFKYIVDLMNNLGYNIQHVTKSNHIYLLSERGYAKLIKIMDTDLAWEIHDKLIDEYFQMREAIKNPYEAMLPKNYLEALKALTKEVEEKQKLEQKIEEDAPKVELAEAFMYEDGSIDISDMHKICRKNDIEIGRNNLYAWCRENGILGKRGRKYNIGTAKAVKAGIVQVVDEPFIKNGEYITTNYKTRVTPKGQNVILTKLNA